MYLMLSDGVKMSLSNEAPEVEEGHSLQVECQVDANPEIDTLVWEKVGDPNFKQEEAVLRLNNVNASNAGTYRCKASNRLTPTGKPPYTYSEIKDADVKVLCGYC